MCNSLKSVFHNFAMFPSSSSSPFEETYLNNHKTNDLESLRMEMYHYVIGNTGILVVHVLLLVIPPSNQL